MRALLTALTLGAPSTALAVPTLEAEGACPGRAVLEVSDLTPRGGVQVFFSYLGTGADHVALGPCADTVTGLRGLVTGPRVRANDDGQVRLTPTLPLGLCGVTAQFLDESTCELSPTLSLGDLTVPGAGVPATFTPCGATGRFGPDQPACDAAYTGTALEGTVTVSAGVQAWRAPRTGRYRITAVGAAGESADASFAGGRGAEISGVFELREDDELEIVVGQMGASDGCNGSGGGGSFVIAAGRPLLVAGGGAGTRQDVDHDGCDAHLDEYAGTGSSSLASWDCLPKLSDLALGGIVSGASWGSAGAGYDGTGAIDTPWGTEVAQGWPSFTGGGGLTTQGGFGGGGSGDGSCGGGGGGGYSGGDGGRLAGGGGSLNTGAATSAGLAADRDHGHVTIEPE